MAHASPPSYYEVLGVARDATPDEIRKAFRSLARTEHPDMGGNDERFKLITQAHNVLIDTRQRQAYDLQLNSTPVVQFAQPTATWPQGGAQRVEDPLSDVYERLLRERERADQQARMYSYVQQPPESPRYYRDTFVPPRYAPPPLKFDRINKTSLHLTWGIVITWILSAASTLFLVFEAVLSGFGPYYLLFSTMSNPNEGSLAPILLMIIGGCLAFFAGVAVKFYIMIAGRNYDLYWFIDSRIKALQTGFIYLGVVGGLLIGHVFF